MKWIKLFEDFHTGHEFLEVKPSTIPNSGMGLFTKADIPKGEGICEFTGKVITSEEADSLTPPESHYLVGRSDGSILNVYNSDSPAIRANDAHGTRFRNNSEIVEYEDGTLWLASTKNIRAGEEIFCSYGSDYWDNWSE
jgi:hypothetical protein